MQSKNYGGKGILLKLYVFPWAIFDLGAGVSRICYHRIQGFCRVEALGFMASETLFIGFEADLIPCGASRKIESFFAGLSSVFG